MTFSKYERYKDSGVEWLGEIPEHWELWKIAHLFTLGRGRVIDKGQLKDNGKYPVYSSQTKDGGIFGYLDSYDFEGVYIVWTTDGANAGTVSYRQGKFNCTNVCGTLKPKDNNLSSRFIAYLLNIQTRFHVRYDINPKLMNDVMSKIKIYLPPIAEQERIAEFLDRKCGEIDEAIAKKQRLIELLDEQKTILINQAVTKGLNPDAPMKDSAIDWLGEIPAHWEVTKLKRVSKVQSGLTLGKQYRQQKLSTYPYLRVANVQYGYFDLSEIATIDIPENDHSKYLVRHGDILVTEGGDLDKLGRGTVWHSEINTCLHQNHVFAIRVRKEIVDEQFISLLMSCDFARKYFIDTASKTTNLASTNRTKLINLPCVIPPFAEQKLIIDTVASISQKIGELIQKNSEQVQIFTELKQILIAEAVTGKIKV